MIKTLSILVAACLMSFQYTHSKTDIYASRDIVNGNTNVSGIPYNRISWGNTVVLNAAIPYPSTNTLGLLNYKTKRLVSYVKLFLNTEAIPTGLTAFTARVPITITYYSEGAPNVVVNKILEVNYDPVTGAQYKNAALEEMQNAYKIEVGYTANTLQIVSGIPTLLQKDFISMQAYVEHERYFNYYGVFGTSYNMNVVTSHIAAAYNTANNEITIDWSAIDQAEGYELEYTYVDDYKNNTPVYTYIPPQQLNFSFRNNSTRILLKENEYTMPLVQEHGYLMFRVRGYGIAGPNLDRIFYGGYHVNVGGGNPNQTFNVATYPYKFAVAGLTHANDKMNWQSVTTFAEEGKSKTVVKYMDGTMRDRQMVTSTSTEKNAIVAETIYDFQGRAAVTILPAPVATPAIQYYRNFNQNLAGQPYSYRDFDYKGSNACDLFNIGPLKLPTNQGAGNYYSDYNPDKTTFNAYIPDANGYPLTRVNFMPDPTNRVVKQGQAGELFQPGNTANAVYQNHDTKYYYGKPEQEKLDRLFGTNAGYAEFYQKNLVLDANGQASVSYLNLEGKIVATALAGQAPANLEQLPGYEYNSLHVNLLTAEDVADENDHSITSSQSFLVSSDRTKYHFSYGIESNTYNALSCALKNYCLDCIYDLDIKVIKDECSQVEYHKKITLGTLAEINSKCLDAHTAFDIDFDVDLNIGSYTVTKKLVVNKLAAEAYANMILADPNNTCLKSYQNFYQAAWENRDTTRCMDSCDSCKEESNEAGSAAEIADAVRECDALWCKPQIANLCDLARISMINDLTPQGQYAIYADSNGVNNLGYSPISIFNAAAAPFAPTLNSAPTAIQNISIVLPGEIPHPLSYWISSSTLLYQLIQNWPDDLSEKLLPIHPEYCYLKFCDQPQVQLSNAFDTKYMSAETYADAQTGGITSAMNTFYQQDPLYQYLNPALKLQMKNRFDNYAGAGNSVVKLSVFAANCPSGNNINSCPGVWGNGSNDDEEWESFRNLYYNIKQEFIQKAREYYVKNTVGCCPNAYIGCETTDSNDNNTRKCHIPIIPMFGNPNNACMNWNLVALYGHAICRFPTINDIPFPNMPNPTGSVYDMTAEEISNYALGGNKEVCPSCPELDAFKLMVFYMQQKGWIENGGVVQADAMVGLKDVLRTRFIGSANNEPITINADSANSFSMNSNNCKITFSSAMPIDWGKVTLVPTCLEIIDYRNAKLHIILDSAEKTVLNITSTCDLFYCEGDKPNDPPGAPSCNCDTAYNATASYQLGNIVKYNGSCYIVIKGMKNGALSPGRNPNRTQYWDKICASDPPVTTCPSPFVVDFESPNVFTSDLTSGTVPIATGKYTIQNNYTAGNGVNQLFLSNAFVARPQVVNTILVAKNGVVTPNSLYKISFDGKLIIDRQMTVQLKVNNVLVSNFTLFSTNNQNFSVIWNSNSNTTVNVALIFTQVRQDLLDIIVMDNFKMECATGQTPGAGAKVADVGAGGTKTAVTVTDRTKKRITALGTVPNRYIPENVCGCSIMCDPPLPSPPLPFIPCEDILKGIAVQQANEAYAAYRDSVFNTVLTGYYKKCMKSIEKFSMDYGDAEYHYTLYYYDQSGNLVSTIPPAGVKPLMNSQLGSVASTRNANTTSQIVPLHIMPSAYRHNALNGVVWQKTPDAGTSEFFYDLLGRNVMGQNAKQRPGHTASYTYYDRLNRAVEIGQIDVNGVNLKARAANYTTWVSFIETGNRTEITHTYYDKPANNSINNAFGATGQKNLRNRVASVAVFDTEADLASFVSTIPQAPQYNHATHYNYDISGNVTEIYQDFGKYTMFGFNPSNINLQSKHIAYYFDLISGKVNGLSYQKGYEDQFLYRYQYNADNKLTHVFTSENGIIWENDARYTYYRHGPLARTELGTDKVQGIDYAYNLQGWIKGANGFANTIGTDIGQDGNASGSGAIGYQNQNKRTAPDVFGYWLGYFQNDYKAIGHSNSTVANTTAALVSGSYNTAPSQLFNGNIRSMYTNLQPFGGLGIQYSYDQLNRVKKQNGFSFTGTTAAATANNAYGMELAYDANGNIQTLLRNGTVTNPAMDDLKYTYYNDDNTTYTGHPNSIKATNRLADVADTVGDIAYPDDIDGQNVLNYSYDNIGNLTKDVKEGILSIDWNLQNKIKEIKKPNTTIGYFYDAMGNRILKGVQNNADPQMTKIEVYVRDAQGNPLATYRKVSDTIFVKEQNIYGSSRLGVKMKEVIVAANYFPINQTPVMNIIDPSLHLPMRKYHFNSYRNTTAYELTNHLGNVLATITDAKTNTAATSAATLLSATDYYAFGMAIPDRKFSLKEYRYGFNGKENDTETSTQDYGFRIYNPSIAKFLSVDPLTASYPWNSTYAFAENDAIRAVDLDGREKSIITYYIDIDGKQIGYDPVPEVVKGSGTEYRYMQNTGGYGYELVKTQFIPDINVTPSITQNLVYSLKTAIKNVDSKVRSSGSMEAFQENQSYHGVDGMYKGAEVLNTEADYLEYTPFKFLSKGLKIMAKGLEVTADINKGKYERAFTRVTLSAIDYGIDKGTYKFAKSAMKEGVEKNHLKAVKTGVNYFIGKVEENMVNDLDVQEKSKNESQKKP